VLMWFFEYLGWYHVMWHRSVGSLARQCFDLSFLLIPEPLRLYAMEQDSKRYKSFPCTHPNCRQTFLSASGRSRHWNAIHREITPASEPDPELQFARLFHPGLNGNVFSKLTQSWNSFAVTLDIQLFHVTRTATTSLCTRNHHNCCQLMRPMTTLGIHLMTA
jgi:hypothetical protein